MRQLGQHGNLGRHRISACGYLRVIEHSRDGRRQLRKPRQASGTRTPAVTAATCLALTNWSKAKSGTTT